jgi:3-hydroxybutyryl-CoA dehydrogenase
MPMLPARVVVIGAGTMGTRIALCFARAGVTVCATSRRTGTLEQAAETIRGEVGGPELLSRIRLTTEADLDLAAAELVIETIGERVEDKVALLHHVAAVVAPDTIVTTNTSSLDLAPLSAALPEPGRFAGLHWFNPADLMRLVEIVPGPATDDATVQTLQGWMAELGKAPVVLHHAVPGFIANRLQYALLREAYALVADGVCSWTDIDCAVTAGLGPRWSAHGPFQTMDLAGLDVHLAVAQALFPALANDVDAPEPLRALVAEGHLGAKSGSGILGDYAPGTPQALIEFRDAMLRSIAAAVASHAPGGSEPTS